MPEGADSRQVAGTVPPPADVSGFYSRLGIVLPRSRREWVSVRCFLGNHTDRRASSSVNVRNGVWRCFACDTGGSPFAAAVARGYSRSDAAALTKEYGLWRDENGARPRSPRTTPIAQPESARIDWNELSERVRAPRARLCRRREYVYVDELGQPLLRAVREDLDDGSKRFWQERFEGGEWTPGLGETRRVLYRLPEVLERSRAGKLVLVVEGEKCVEALERIDVFATTSPAGAGKWRDAYADMLSGAIVCPVPDCDLPGRRHAVDVCRSLLERSERVLGPLELDLQRSDGFDLTDYLAGVAETVRAVEPTVAANELRRRLREHVRRLVRACLPATGDTVRDYRERAEYFADPRGRLWRHCERCGRARAQDAKAGILYCPCGASGVA